MCSWANCLPSMMLLLCCRRGGGLAVRPGRQASLGDVPGAPHYALFVCIMPVALAGNSFNTAAPCTFPAAILALPLLRGRNECPRAGRAWPAAAVARNA